MTVAAVVEIAVTIPAVEIGATIRVAEIVATVAAVAATVDPVEIPHHLRVALTMATAAITAEIVRFAITHQPALAPSITAAVVTVAETGTAIETAAEM